MKTDTPGQEAGPKGWKELASEVPESGSMSSPAKTQTRSVAAGRATPGHAVVPHRRLLLYYALQSLLSGPFVIFVFPFRFFRYATLRYAFDDEGVTMRWGVLFRREISLTYARIQDIHLVSNVVERWLGLGRVQIQTASGNAAAEMVIEGLPDFEALRDELYLRMRGVRPDKAASDALQPVANVDLQEVTEALLAATAELRALRDELSRQRA